MALTPRSKTLFIYIPTYKRGFWLDKQLGQLAPQLAKYPGQVRILVNHNSLPNDEFYGIISKYAHYSEIEFRFNPGNILANANITLGFIFAEHDKFLWILSDDDTVLNTSLDEIMPSLTEDADFVHMGNYSEKKHLELRINNVFTVTQGAGLGLISVVIYRMGYIKGQLYNGFEYIDSSFPHLAITLAALRQHNCARMSCVRATHIFAFEGALSDGDYSQSKLGYVHLTDFFPKSDARVMAWNWIVSSWKDFIAAGDTKTLLNNKSRFFKSSGLLRSMGIKFQIFLFFAVRIYRGKQMLKKISYVKEGLKRRIKKFTSLGNDGERLDMKYRKDIRFEDLDVYEKSHVKRYHYALDVIAAGKIVGDFACGTGYGSVILSEKSDKVVGVDISKKTIQEVKKRYKDHKNIDFQNKNLLNLDYKEFFDYVVSFETVEHLEEHLIPPLFSNFYKALKRGGKIILSTPFMQETPPPEIPLNYHLTHEIDEKKIEKWLNNSGFKVINFKYQNYETHEIVDSLAHKDMIICLAEKV